MKNHRTSLRLEGWDYGWDGAYFVTICTHNRVCIFGDIVADKTTGEITVHLSDLGKIADNIWREIPENFSFTRLGVHVIMPNHLHGIILIDKPSGLEKSTDAIHRFPSQNTKKPGGITGTKNPMLHDNLSRAIRWYKGRTTFECRKILPKFKWHSRFHDVIINDGNDFERITDYITNNPRKWYRTRNNRHGHD